MADNCCLGSGENKIVEDLIHQLNHDNSSGEIFLHSNLRLSQTIVIKSKKKRVTIEGDPDKDIIIEGNGHCIFQVIGKQCCITFKNITFNHIAFAEDKRDVGAAVFVMGDSETILINCRIKSFNGFGIWGVQKAKCSVTNCLISSSQRSGCVFFGKSTLNVDSTRINECGQHGICVRGSVRLIVTNCSIKHCCVRGIYAYDKAQVSISHSIVSLTQSTDHSAMDFWGGSAISSENLLCQSTELLVCREKCPPERRFRRSSSPARNLCVSIDSVYFYLNNGCSIRCRDNVTYTISNCYYYSKHFDLSIPLKCNPFIAGPSFLHYDFDFRSVQWIMVNGGDKDLSEREFIKYSHQFLKMHVSNSQQSLGEIRWEFLHNDSIWIEYDHPSIHNYLSLHYYNYLSDCYTSKNSDIFLPEPYEHYRINFRKLEQINIRTYFTRSIRWRILDLTPLNGS